MTHNNEYSAELSSYDLGFVLTHEAGPDCVVVHVGLDEKGVSVGSLQWVRQEIEKLIDKEPERVAAATKLFVVGTWNFSFGVYDVVEQDPGTEKKPRGFTLEEGEWNIGIDLVCTLMHKMSSLKHLTWISTLPFTATVWAYLTTALETLVIDIGAPIRLDGDDNKRPIYMGQEEMRPLTTFTKLEELRIFNINDNLQVIIWETLFRNDSARGEMRLLEITMANEPFVREKTWVKGKDVFGLKVPIMDAYKGVDGKGILHHQYGTGAYLDDFAMRKGRLASGNSETRPLPLTVLKLNAFVIDHLPFKTNELSRLILLVCGPLTVDAGLIAPTTANPRDVWASYITKADHTNPNIPPTTIIAPASVPIPNTNTTGFTTGFTTGITTGFTTGITTGTSLSSPLTSPLSSPATTPSKPRALPTAYTSSYYNITGSEEAKPITNCLIDFPQWFGVFDGKGEYIKFVASAADLAAAGAAASGAVPKVKNGEDITGEE